MSGDLRLL